MALPRVLIVEDDVILTMDLRRTLDRFKFETVGVCRTGAEGVRLARLLQPDIVLMDIRLYGDMDGIRAARIIKQQTKCAIIFLTANTDEVTIRQAEETKPSGIVAKPYSKEIIRGVIETALVTSAGEHQRKPMKVTG